jgi:hypothetical protein
MSYIWDMQTETLSVRISSAESRALDDRARKDGISKGSLVRRALRAYGLTPELESGETGYDVIKHLVGKARGGSRDLSTNPEHLADYGQ